MNPQHWRRRRWIGAAVVVVVVGFAAAYALLFRGSNVAPLAISAPASTHAPSSAATVAGSWRVAAGSSAGYRVREQLGFAPAASDAVGRTTSIAGTATLTSEAGHVSLTAASFTVDVSQLTSDDARRDDRIRGIGLETDRFPSASFTLTGPVTIPDAALTGASTSVTVKGDLTLHGVTRSETFQLTVAQDGSGVDVAGSLRFPWGDFAMTAPNVGDFVTVQGDPVLEFKLVLAKG